MKKVAVIMGSISDLPVMQGAVDQLKSFEIPYEVEIVSAHRTPERMIEFAKTARANDFAIIIAGAGGAAHLPGMVAAVTDLPVIGVPCKSRISIDGIDSLYSIVQMPPGVPVATMAIDGGGNAGVLAAQIFGAFDSDVATKLVEYKQLLKEKVKIMNNNLDQ